MDFSSLLCMKFIILSYMSFSFRIFISYRMIYSHVCFIFFFQFCFTYLWKIFIAKASFHSTFLSLIICLYGSDSLFKSFQFVFIFLKLFLCIFSFSFHFILFLFSFCTLELRFPKIELSITPLAIWPVKCHQLCLFEILIFQKYENAFSAKYIDILFNF